ncbi:MAG: N-acetyltransferase [Spirochaetota bacterium]
MGSLEVKPVETRKDFKNFLDLPGRLYRNDPSYVEPLRVDIKFQFNRKKNPFFKHGDEKSFLARTGDQVVGRITAIRNDFYVQYQEKNSGFFTFFDCVDDQETANGLFRAAESWLKQQGMENIIGPMSFSGESISPGLLIKGFDCPPFLLMAHGLPYYQRLVEAQGFEKTVDVLAFSMPIQQDIDPRLVELAQRVKHSRNISVRPFDPKNFWRDAKVLMDIYIEAWKDNWGFIPPTEEEFYDVVKTLKKIYIRELVQIAEVDGQPVGWAMTLPNINEVLIHMNGRLFPFGIFKLLYWMKRTNSLRLWGLGIKPEYRKRGVDAVLYYHTLMEGQRLGYTVGELSWILETNTPIIRAAHLVKGREYKRYRIYQKAI